jgi:hypothetical protein
MKLYIHIYCLFLAVFASRGAEFDFGNRGKLSISIPDDWTINGHAMKTDDGTPMGYTFAIKPRSDANAKCLLTFIYAANGAPNREAISKEVLRLSEHFVSESVEKKQNLKGFSLEKGYGSYCLFTDASLVGKKALPGDYKVMGAGEVQPGDNIKGAVTLFADEADGVDMKAMIKIVNSLKVKLSDAK